MSHYQRVMEAVERTDLKVRLDVADFENPKARKEPFFTVLDHWPVQMNIIPFFIDVSLECDVTDEKSHYSPELSSTDFVQFRTCNFAFTHQEIDGFTDERLDEELLLRFDCAIQQMRAVGLIERT